MCLCLDCEVEEVFEDTAEQIPPGWTCFPCSSHYSPDCEGVAGYACPAHAVQCAATPQECNNCTAARLFGVSSTQRLALLRAQVKLVIPRLLRAREHLRDGARRLTACYVIWCRALETYAVSIETLLLTKRQLEAGATEVRKRTEVFNALLRRLETLVARIARKM